MNSRLKERQDVLKKIGGTHLHTLTQYLEMRIDKAHKDLETCDEDKFKNIQGKIQGWREILHDCRTLFEVKI